MEIVDMDLQKHSVLTKRDSFWESSFESLKKLFDTVLETETKWTTPGGGCKQYENNALHIRWHTTNKILTIEGLESQNLKSKLMTLAVRNQESQSNDKDENVSVLCATTREQGNGQNQVSQSNGEGPKDNDDGSTTSPCNTPSYTMQWATNRQRKPTYK